MLRDWLEAAQRRAGLEVMGSLHKLRHTFCSHLAIESARDVAIALLNARPAEPIAGATLGPGFRK